MNLPALTHWNDTKTALHQAFAPLLIAHLAAVEPLPNALRYGMYPTPFGATTFNLSTGGRLELDYRKTEIRYIENSKTAFTVSLDGHSQKSLTEEVFSELQSAGHPLKPDMSKAESTARLNINNAQARDYAEVQWRMALTLAWVKARLTGFQTPVLVWGHGFDLSTLWFAGGSDDHKDPHINFGFSPGTPEVGQPYVYFYAHPAQNGLEDRIPDLFDWNSAWSTPGGVLRYDRFAREEDPESLVVDALLDVYRIAATMLQTGA